MKEFYIRSAVVTFCLIVLSRFFQLEVHSHTTNNFQQPSSSSMQEMAYELVNETTRFNKKTGDLEYFIQCKNKAECEMDSRYPAYYGSWMPRNRIWLNDK